MNQPDPTETAIDRIPLSHSVRYVARGLPDVPNQYGQGVLRPSEITLTYRASPDSQLGRVHAYVAGRLWVDGREIPLLPSGGLYGQYHDDGLPSWPEWLTEEARLHDPERTPISQATEQTEAYRLALSEALGLGAGAPWDAIQERAAELVAPVVPSAPTSRALATVRPNTLAAIARHLDGRAVAILRAESQTYAEWQTVAAELCRLAAVPAAEEQPGILPPPEGPEYLPCACGHIEPDHDTARGKCIACGCSTFRTAAEEQPENETPDAEPSEEQIVREHVTTLHLIGQQLSEVENWMWHHLADVRAAATPPTVAPQSEETPLGADRIFPGMDEQLRTDDHVCGDSS